MNIHHPTAPTNGGAASRPGNLHFLFVTAFGMQYTPLHNADGCICRSELASPKQALAEELWRRLRPHFQQGDIVGIQPTGFGNEGLWLPTGLNECIKMIMSIYGRGHFLVTSMPSVHGN